MSGFLKDYEPVEDRLRAFWSDHPDGRVVTVLVDHGDGEYIVRAEVFRSADELPAASGLARDSTAELPPNMRGSALEVCETSAIGRALANLGYAPKGKRPSREEMSKASRAPAGQEVSNVAQGRSQTVPGPSQNVQGSGNSASAAAEDRGVSDGPGRSSGPSPPSSGEAAAASAEPGEDEDLGKAPSLGSTRFPYTPENCNHKFGTTGNWLKPVTIAGMDHGPRCGMKTVLYRESDVGP